MRALNVQKYIHCLKKNAYVESTQLYTLFEKCIC